MAWKEIQVLEQRKLFIIDFLSGNYNISALCRAYDISRPTAYLWIERYNQSGEEGLLNRRSTPHYQPRSTSSDIEDEILKIKLEHLEWGPKKIKGNLNLCKPHLNIPSVTTVGNILKKYGLVQQKKLKKRLAERTQPLAHAIECNDVWSADFKGWFITKDGLKCEPFTLTDNTSRYLLKCLQLDLNDTDHLWAVLNIAFQENGLPLYLRTDNGPPFASKGPGRLSRFSVKLIKAGVMPDFIDPGKPAQNGRHERMHGTLKSEYVFPDLTLTEQILKLEKFQSYYNFERPHEALNQVPPGHIYKPSCRIWNGKLKGPEYPDRFKKAKVRTCGKMHFNGKEIYIGYAFVDEYIGIEETEDGFKGYFGTVYLGDIKTEGLEFPRRQVRNKNKSYKNNFY